MADRTHSHDTSTAAMSAETVPSEEFVLVPREPTPAMVDAGTKAGIAATPWCPAAYRAMIAAAPQRSSAATKAGDAVREAVTEVLGSELNCAYDCTRVWEAWSVGTMSQNDFQPVNDRLGEIVEAVLATLSASHLAKEGGDDEETTLENRIDNAVQAMSETHHSWEARCHAIMAALGFNFGWATPRVDEEPSPALAKDGDAVREALEWYAKTVDDCRKITSEGETARTALDRDGGDRARAALSTPTEGPASQTEGMGGDAVREDMDGRYNIEAIAKVISLSYGENPEDEAPLSRICGPNNEPLPCWMAYEEQAEAVWIWMQAVLAALTPPETAEAVPVAETPRCPYCDGTGDVHRADGEWMGECDCSDGRAVRLREELDRVTRERDTFADICLVVSGHLELPHSESGPCDDSNRYDRALEAADIHYRQTEAARAEHMQKRFEAEAEAAQLREKLRKAYAERSQLLADIEVLRATHATDFTTMQDRAEAAEVRLADAVKALETLEAACDHVAGIRSEETYLRMLADKGAGDALCALDAARAAARSASSQGGE